MGPMKTYEAAHRYDQLTVANLELLAELKAALSEHRTQSIGTDTLHPATNWAQVGDVAEINSKLRLAVAFLKGDDEEPEDCEHNSVISIGDVSRCQDCKRQVRTPRADEHPTTPSGNRAMWVQS